MFKLKLNKLVPIYFSFSSDFETICWKWLTSIERATATAATTATAEAATRATAATATAEAATRATASPERISLVGIERQIDLFTATLRRD